jgi:hypothetical protein
MPQAKPRREIEQMIADFPGSFFGFQEPFFSHAIKR